MYSDRRRSTERRATRGVSLLEALAATALLAVALLGFSSNSVSLTRSAKTADSVAVAMGLAQQRLELIRSSPLGAVVSGSFNDATTLKANGTANGPYSRSWVITLDTPRSGVRTVTVSVSWTDSRAHTVQLAAYVRCPTVPCPNP